MANARQHEQALGKRAFWTEFFALYESLPALWDLNDPLYKDRQSKSHGYEMLVMKMREIDPHACREDVLRKINIFRTNYRRECARIKASNRMGKRYTTSLWYFHMLNFLQNQEFRKDRKRAADDEKRILRRVGSKIQCAQSIAESVKSNVSSTHTIQDNSNEYKNEHTKYEYISDNGNESEEHLEGVQYTDERSFQHQFQNQFHTLSFSNQRQMKSLKEPMVQELETDAEDYHEIINIDDSSHVHEEMLEELEPVEVSNKGTLNETTDSTPPELTEQLITTHKTTKASINTSRPSERIERQPHAGPPAISEASEILARSWAIQYEEMSVEQRIYARKAIAEILFEGCMGNLGRRRNVQAKVPAADAVVSSQYEQTNVVEENVVTENDTGENIIHMDDDSHTYVYAGGGGATLQLREYIH